MTIKVFKIGDHDWVAAEDLASAKTLAQDLGLDDEDFDEDAVELTPAQLDAEMFHAIDEDSGVPTVPLHSFKVELEKRIAEGQAFPQIFATTEY